MIQKIKYVLKGLHQFLFEDFVQVQESPKCFYYKDDKDEADRNSRIIDMMPSLKTFVPLFYAKQGFSQTIIQTLHKYSFINPKYERVILNNCIALDWVKARQNAPTIVFFHGLGGNSYTDITKIMVNSFVSHGYNVCVFNRRGHNTSSMIDPAICVSRHFPRYTCDKDTDTVLKYINSKYPNTQIFLIGISCGANIVVNYLATEESKHRNIIAAVSVSNGFDLTRCIDSVDDVNNELLCSFLKDVIYEHSNEYKKYYPEEYALLMKAKTLKEFDSHLLKFFGFNTTEEYYYNDSSGTKLKNIRQPLLCINNESDPFIHNDMLNIPRNASQTNPNIISVITKYGGHGSWIDSLYKENWSSRVILEYLKTFI